MTFAYRENIQALRPDLLEKYGPVFRRIADGTLERERQRILPREQIAWLKEAGFPAVRVPREEGGDGGSIVDLAALLIALAEADPNIPQALRGHVVFSEDRLFADPGPERDVWLKRFADGEIAGNAWTEIGTIGLWQTATSVKKDGDALRLDGRKFYTTGSIFADWIDVLARREDGADVLALVRKNSEGVKVSDDWDGFGQRTTGSGEAVFQSVLVEPQNVLLYEERVPYQHALYQLVLLASLAGIGRAIVRDTAEQIRNRTRVYSTGAGPSDRQDPQIQQVVGQLAGLAYATESSTLRAAAAIQRVFEAKAAGPDAVKAANDTAHVEVYSAQIIVTEFTQRAGSLLFNALSASAARESHALDRHWRNARTISSHNPVINKERIVGDWHINGTAPPINWSIGVPLATQGTGETAAAAQ
ncbi:acyl-CoA dehydrogenase family protein [Sinorhizobium sp. BG8]|uniref:acyl-CoA dehydrogenase family protein n=1 Tax=Sinorhizobium sp. BG8 TaxID=2613773 RepID=UPI00193D214F|nr:acyl-CoA dehydrogenase family protein [Sinorhizobium sp. BG8]QRM57217.1 monooxygenase [Sinorhizobium sp. BG8]